jgi:hypothetical protein
MRFYETRAVRILFSGLCDDRGNPKKKLWEKQLEALVPKKPLA